MVPAFKDMASALKRADTAAARSKSKVRNWRPDTDAQIAAKAGKRRNQIVTSSDLNRAGAGAVNESLTPDSRPVKAGFRGTASNEFSHPRSARVLGEREPEAGLVAV
jgi:hypothetical protein